MEAPIEFNTEFKGSHNFHGSNICSPITKPNLNNVERDNLSRESIFNTRLNAITYQITNQQSLYSLTKRFQTSLWEI